MSKYVVIAGAVPAVHKRAKVIKGQILDASFFKEGEIAELTKAGFIAEAEGDGTDAAPTGKKNKKADAAAGDAAAGK